MRTWNRREFLQYNSMAPALMLPQLRRAPSRPNILLLMSDNHSWNHLGCYGDPVVRTPQIDSVAGRGVRFRHAFCAAPSCSPARAGLLTGQDIWRLEEGANLWGILPDKFPFYTDLLEEAGYHVGCEGKGWGPGSVAMSGRRKNHAGTEYESFDAFLQANASAKPWCYWFSSRNPHRPYTVGSGVASGMDLKQVPVPAYLPDTEVVRSDICDYYFEVQQFDREVGLILNKLEDTGQAENTLIIICSDNGWQMPRGLANLYDFGGRIPLIMSWADRISPGRVVDDFINLNDLAPTFLDLAGLEIPEAMTAASLTNLLFSEESGQINAQRNHVITARERHALCRYNGVGYPGRALRTRDFLYIRNFEPERWPAGDPPLFGDVDAHMLQYPCPSKMYLLQHRHKPEVAPLFELAFGKRPAEELYDLRKDAACMSNVASLAEYEPMRQGLRRQLEDYLRKTGDPRILGGEIIWDTAMYYQPKDFIPRPGQEAIQVLGLQEEYNYFTPGPW
ncbi:MAG: sulfatase family protein [Acidobacteriota bacterium]